MTTINAADSVTTTAASAHDWPLIASLLKLTILARETGQVRMCDPLTNRVFIVADNCGELVVSEIVTVPLHSGLPYGKLSDGSSVSDLTQAERIGSVIAGLPIDWSRVHDDST